MATSGQQNDGALAHAWAYFQLHAQQRITIFNYFVVFSGILATGLAAAIQGPPRLASVGVALGLLLSFLSYIFWQIDRRTSFLVKHSEDAIKSHEPTGAQLMTDEVAKTDAAKMAEGLWTYGRAFRVIFGTMALVGTAGAIVSGLRWSGCLAWDQQKAPPQVVATQVPSNAVASDAPTPQPLATPTPEVGPRQPIDLPPVNAMQITNDVAPAAGNEN